MSRSRTLSRNAGAVGIWTAKRCSDMLLKDLGEVLTDLALVELCLRWWVVGLELIDKLNVALTSTEMSGAPVSPTAFESGHYLTINARIKYPRIYTAGRCSFPRWWMAGREAREVFFGRGRRVQIMTARDNHNGSSTQSLVADLIHIKTIFFAGERLRNYKGKL